MHEDNLASSEPAPRRRSFDSEHRDRRAAVAACLFTIGMFSLMKAFSILGDLRTEAEDDYNAERAAYHAAVDTPYEAAERAQDAHSRAVRARARARTCQ